MRQVLRLQQFVEGEELVDESKVHLSRINYHVLMMTDFGLLKRRFYMETNTIKISFTGQFSGQNILHHISGPTAFTATRVHKDDEASAFFNESMVGHV